MSLVQVLVPERWAVRLRAVVPRLIVSAILAAHGIGSAAEAAAPAAAQRPVAVGQADGVLLDVTPIREQGAAVQGSDSPPRVPRPEAPRLGEGVCCKTLACRCGCLNSLAAIAIAALNGGWFGGVWATA